jgi:glycosyltransferase involved in cell wall biosynthesis
MIGPVLTDVSRYEEIPNLKFLGPVVYADVPAYLQRFDVCIMPFKVNDLTRDVNPVKMYEYLAAGKPIVSTYLPEVAQYGEVCAIGHTPEEFIFLVRRALAERELSEAKRQQLKYARVTEARANSWEIRTSAVLECITQHIGKQQSR